MLSIKIEPQVIFGTMIGLSIFFINVGKIGTGFIESLGWAFLFGTLAWGIGVLMIIFHKDIT